MKRIIAILLCLLLLSALLPACGSPAAQKSAGSLSIVTAIFPVYDWTREILGDTGSAELTLLLDSGVDLHSFQPSAGDILQISACDLFIYVGGESDAWVADALAESPNVDRIDIDLMTALGDGAKEEQLVEGMEPDDEGEEGETEYDEHIWLSLRNAEALCAVIADALAELDPANAETYEANAAAYTAKLEALDGAYADAVNAAAYDTVLFGDRFPFRYMTDDYGLTYYAAFAGCSAETEASFDTVIFLADKVDVLGLPAVLTIEGTDHRIAETVVQNTASKDQPILTMDSMQGTTEQDAEAGATYLGIMEKNLAVLKQALNG